MTCEHKTMRFSVQVTVTGGTMPEAEQAAQYLRDRIEDSEKELAENAENESATPSSFTVLTSTPYAVDRPVCLIGGCDE